MEIKDKVLKIEAYIDSVIDHNEVLNSLNPVDPDDISSVIVNAPMCSIMMMGKDEYVKSLYTNDISYIGGINVYRIHSMDTRSTEMMNFQLEDELSETTGQYYYVPDTLRPDTSIEELEEIVFNISLQYGKLFYINKLLFTYVLCKKYLSLIPNESLFFIVFYGDQSVYKLAGIE